MAGRESFLSHSHCRDRRPPPSWSVETGCQGGRDVVIYHATQIPAETGTSVMSGRDKEILFENHRRIDDDCSLCVPKLPLYLTSLSQQLRKPLCVHVRTNTPAQDSSVEVYVYRYVSAITLGGAVFSRGIALGRSTAEKCLTTQTGASETDRKEAASSSGSRFMSYNLMKRDEII